MYDKRARRESMDGLLGISTYNGTMVRPHDHPFWELAYYTDGTGSNCIEGRDYDFDPGVLLVIPPRIMHGEHSEKPFSNIFMQFQKCELDSATVHFFRDNVQEDLYILLNQIHRKMLYKGNRWQFIIARLMDTLYEYLLSMQDANEKSIWVERFEHVLCDNLSNPDFDIGEAIGNIPLADRYFRILFTKETGKAPLQYLLSKRIEKAKYLLSCTTFTIREIADASGFRDPYYFSRLFKKHCGTGPKDWRKQQLRAYSPEK